MRVLMLSVLVATTTAACTWVPIEQSGKSVQVLPAGPVPAGCQQQGEVVVTVKSKVGFYNRNRCACRKSWKHWRATRRPAPMPMRCRHKASRPMAANVSTPSAARRAEPLGWGAGHSIVKMR